MDSCHSVVYLTAFQLFDMLSKAAFGGERSAQNYQQTYPYLFDCDLLIIDDLGTDCRILYGIPIFPVYQ